MALPHVEAGEPVMSLSVSHLPQPRHLVPTPTRTLGHKITTFYQWVAVIRPNVPTVPTVPTGMKPRCGRWVRDENTFSIYRVWSVILGWDVGTGFLKFTLYQSFNGLCRTSGWDGSGRTLNATGANFLPRATGPPTWPPFP